MDNNEPKKRKSSVPSFIVLAIVGIGVFFYRQCGQTDQTQSGSTSSNSSTNSAQSMAFSGGGYILQFEEAFNPGLTRVDDLGISVVLAIDVSGSMADNPVKGLAVPKYQQASKALVQILDFLEELQKSPFMQGMKLRLGVLTFYEQVNVVQSLTDMDTAAFQNLRTKLSTPGALDPNGPTAIGLALEKSTEMLAQSGTILKSILVVSDGENTAGNDPAAVLFAINNNRNNFNTLDSPVLTSGTLTSIIGFDVDTALYQPIAKEGARIVAASNQEELQAALRQVLTADITRLEAAGP